LSPWLSAPWPLQTAVPPLSREAWMHKKLAFCFEEEDDGIKSECKKEDFIIRAIITQLREGKAQSKASSEEESVY